MKELSIEEKAKRYDEAIKVASELHDKCKVGSQTAFHRVNLERMFPELKESEDERWIKFIKNQLFNIKKTITDNYKLDKELTDAIAWLEKQGEHANFRNKIQIGDKVTRNEDGVLVNLSQLNRVAKKQGEQKSVWSEENESLCMQIKGLLKVCLVKNLLSFDLYKKMCDLLKSLKDRVQPQLKQEWSKEDESNINDIKSIIYENCRTEDVNRLIEWLMSLKPQPKKEWSEEDKQIIKNMQNDYHNRLGAGIITQKYYDKIISWLKSLRPQSQWKPSEEMLKALYRAVPKCVTELSEDEILLDKLYQGLKYGKVLSK